MKQKDRDKMVVIKVLYQSMNWSFSRIARVVSESDKTVKSIYMKSLEETEDTNLRDLPKGRKSIDLRYVGDSHDIEYLDAVINHNVCGGGRKVDNSGTYD